MAVSGNGVVPNWTIEPKFLVARLEAKPEKSEELKMKVKKSFENNSSLRILVKFKITIYDSF